MLKLSAVDLGSQKIKIPVAQIDGRKEGIKLFITAGSDGDEYAGIEAAYKIIKEFYSRNFCGRLTVIPILNLPGFEAVQSRNPLDQKYPKHIFPGKKNGTPSEKLIYWLTENYIDCCDVWLDFHGGGINEVLDPYIYIYETKNKKVNEMVIRILKTINAPKIVYKKPGVWQKVEELAKREIVYMITEAGCLGERDKIMIEKHIEWTKTIMEVLGMIEGHKNTRGVAQRPALSEVEEDSPRVEESVKCIYRQIRSYGAKHTGLWYPTFNQHEFISKGMKLGEVRSYEDELLEDIIARNDGEYLWMRQGLICPKGDTLIEAGYETIDITDIDYSNS